MYKQITENVVQRLSDGAFIPFDNSNPDYQEFKTWVDAGNSPIVDTSTPVPQEVTMRQARIALLSAGKLASVDVLINSLPEPSKTLAKIECEYSNTVQRHNGFVSQIAPQLGMTEIELDSLFIEAAKL